MAGTVDVGTGTTLTFGTSSYSAELLDLQINDITFSVINTHHMGTTGAITKRAGDLYDPGSLTCQFHLDPDDPATAAPFNGAEETITVTFPVPSGGMAGATLAGSGFVSAHSYSVPLEDKMLQRMTITFTDDLTWSDST